MVAQYAQVLSNERHALKVMEVFLSEPHKYKRVYAQSNLAGEEHHYYPIAGIEDGDHSHRQEPEPQEQKDLLVEHVYH